MSNCSTTKCIAIKGSVSQAFLEEKAERCWDTNFMLELRGIARPLSVSQEEKSLKRSRKCVSI